MSSIGFIGTGHIAAPMVRFLAARDHDITVSERNADTAEALSTSHRVEVAPNQAVIDRSDIVFLCLRPGVAAEALEGLSFRPDQRVVSVMAGVPLAQLRDLCTPATDITMTIPLGFLEQGGCPLPACPKADVLAALFSPENPVLEVPDERAFMMHFAVCAFVPGMLDMMVTAADWLGTQTQDPDQAAFYTRQLLSGFLSTLPEGGAQVLPAERDALATAGTLSLQMTKGLHETGTHEALRATLEAIGACLANGS